MFFGEIDDEGDVQSGVGGPAFAAGHTGAVVGVVEDDGVVGEAGFFDFFEALASVGVGFADFVVVLGPVLADFGGVGVVGGDADVFGFGDLGVRAGADLAFVAFGGIEDGEEGLVFGAVFPGGVAGRGVPEFGGLAEVVVGFAVVGAVVAGLAEEFGVHLGAFRHGDHGAHVDAAGAGRVEAGDDGGAGRGADWGDRPGFFEEHAFGGEGVDVRGAGDFVSVTAHGGAVVFAGEPEDVRLVRSGKREAEGEENEGEKGFHGCAAGVGEWRERWWGAVVSRISA